MIYQESDQVRDLKLKYQRSLNDKADILANYASSLLHDDGGMLTVDDELQLELLDELHKLAGSTGMYGYDKLSQKCRKAMTFAQQQRIDKLYKALTKLEAKFREVANIE